MTWKPLLALFLIPCAALAQAAPAFKPPEVVQPDEGKVKALQARLDVLDRAIASLRRQGVRDPVLADIEIHRKAAEWTLRLNEFYDKATPDWTLDIINRGLMRANQTASGETPWLFQTGHAIARAYRSRLDDSVQPYAVTFPADYGKNQRKKWRVDVVLHGRNDRLTEVAFLRQMANRPAPKEQDWVQIEVYGRGNNAYRWAGEADVYEAIDNFLAVERALRRDGLLDLSRVVLRGFSMGGAGTWHLGLHRPDRWCVLGPGAGFTVTRGYGIKADETLPSYQEACLKIYDAVEYAENVFNVPVVAYSGEKDRQIAAARNIEARLRGTGLSIQHLVAPGLEHRFPPEWFAKANAEYGKHVARGRSEYPPKVRFVTYTLKYPSCDWVDILALEAHYRKALVEAEQTDTGFTVKTQNVRRLRLGLPVTATRALTTVKIDQDKLEIRPYLGPNGDLHLWLDKKEGRWHETLPQRVLVDRQRRPQKSPGLQGPIDDAFTAPFLCVKGTGKAWNAAVQRYAEADLARFQREWEKYLRGKLPVKEDVDVTPEDLAGKHLILFGDPGSNSLLAQALDGLPLTWTRESLTLAGKKTTSADHIPALIYPSPFAVDRYVVLNSGHTFHEAEFTRTNALLYPRLGDYALLKLTGDAKLPLAMEVATAGLFDEFWKVGK